MDNYKISIYYGTKDVNYIFTQVITYEIYKKFKGMKLYDLNNSFYTNGEDDVMY